MNTGVSDAMIVNAVSSMESDVNLDPANLSPQKEVVRKFYKHMWDKGEISLIPELLHENFTFRGSLGPTLVGHTEFSEYVRWVTGTLGDYTSEIFALIEEGCHVAVKLRFHGRQRKPLFGRSPTGRRVWWDGTAIFRFDRLKVRDLWVLGDVDGLLGRLDGRLAQGAEFTIGKPDQ